MPKQRGGKSGKKGKRKGGGFGERRELIFATKGQVYANVKNLLGSCRFELYCDDGVTRLGHVRGSMQKKVWIKKGDTVLACLRDFQDSKADIFHVFTADETRILEAKGEIVRGNQEDEKKEHEDMVLFSSEFDSLGDVDIDGI